jgi:hypothetical protein
MAQSVHQLQSHWQSGKFARDCLLTIAPAGTSLTWFQIHAKPCQILSEFLLTETQSAKAS